MGNLLQSLTLPFLGDRPYLHGTTLFTVMREYCNDGEDLTFKINRLIETDHVELIEFDPTTAATSDYHATLVWSEREVLYGVGVTPLMPSPAIERQVYDEAAIVGLADFQGSAVVLREPTSYSFISNVVALNKALLLRQLSPPQTGQWLFTRLELDRIPAKTLPLRLELKKNVNYLAVSSDINVADVSIGQIIFSWWAK